MPFLLFESALAILLFIIGLFVTFYVVVEGSSWQKHRIVGVFARIIQKSARRAFFIFLILMILTIPACLGVLAAFWINAVETHTIPNTTAPIVMVILTILFLLSFMLPVTWGRFRTWRIAVRSAAEVRVKRVE